MPLLKEVLGFFMVAVPCVWVGTLILSWFGKRLTAKPPYADYEEFRRDVLGDVPIDDILDRCDGRLPFQESLVDKEAAFVALVQDLLRESSRNDLVATGFTPCSPLPDSRVLQPDTPITLADLCELFPCRIGVPMTGIQGAAGFHGEAGIQGVCGTAGIHSTVEVQKP